MVPGTSVFLSSETGMSGNFEIASRVPSTISHFKTEIGGWLDGITNAMDMSLIKLQEMVKDSDALRASLHGIAKSQT